MDILTRILTTVLIPIRYRRVTVTVGVCSGFGFATSARAAAQARGSGPDRGPPRSAAHRRAGVGGRVVALNFWGVHMSFLCSYDCAASKHYNDPPTLLESPVSAMLSLLALSHERERLLIG